MKILKIIETAIDVYDCLGVCSDDDNVLNILIESYENRCFNNCFISKITRLVKCGDCIVNAYGSPGFGTMSVMFEAEAVEYFQGEIITGCKITSRSDNGQILCQSEVAKIIINSHSSLASLRLSQVISVVVGEARYSRGSSVISVNAVPHAYPDTSLVYQLHHPAVGSEALAAAIKRAEDEEARAALLLQQNAKGREVFQQILYPYKETQVPPPHAKVASIMDLAKKFPPEKVQFISRDIRIDWSSPQVYLYESEPPGLQNPPQNCLSAERVLCDLLLNYSEHLRVVREMTLLYSDPAILSDHKNLWQIYAKYKKKPDNI